jgi:hypothetical protein
MNQLMTTQLRADIVAEGALRAVRLDPKDLTTLNAWHEGRANAVAFLCPTPATLAAANETRFLCGPYYWRHHG